MIFSRKADSDDFIKESERWDEILHPDVRELIRNGHRPKAVHLHRHHSGVGIFTAKQVIEDYMCFREAWKDFCNNQEVYVQY